MIPLSCNYRGEGSSCTGCEARAPSTLGSGRWWAGQIRPALLISQPLIDMCSHCESPPSLLRYLLGKGCGYWLCHFFISILLLICSLFFTRATRQGGSVHVFHCVCVCVCECVPGVGGGWCRRACNTQALDWLEPCSSMTLIFRVQAREGKMLVSWARSCSVRLI